MSTTLLVLLLVSCFAFPCTKCGQLYMRTTVNEPARSSKLEDQVFPLDPKTGKLGEMVVQTFVTLNASITIDGISAIDTKRNVLYYTTDSDASFVYSADLTSKTLFPPLNLNLYAISGLFYDNIKDELLVAGVVLNPFSKLERAYFVRVPPLGGDREILWTQLASTKTMDGGFAANDIENEYYFAQFVPKAKSSPITTMDAKTGIFTSKNVSCGGITKLFYDNKLRKLVGTAETLSDDKIQYYLVDLNLTTGACATLPLSFDTSKVLVTATAFDAEESMFYYASAQEGASYINSYDAKTEKTTNIKIQSFFAPEDIVI